MKIRNTSTRNTHTRPQSQRSRTQTHVQLRGGRGCCVTRCGFANQPLPVQQEMFIRRTFVFPLSAANATSLNAFQIVDFNEMLMFLPRLVSGNKNENLFWGEKVGVCNLVMIF